MKDRPKLSVINKTEVRSRRAYRTRVKRGLRELFVEADSAIRTANETIGNLNSQVSDLMGRLEKAHSVIPEELVPPGPLHKRVAVLMMAIEKAGQLMERQEMALRNATGINAGVKKSAGGIILP